MVQFRFLKTFICIVNFLYILLTKSQAIENSEFMKNDAIGEQFCQVTEDQCVRVSCKGLRQINQIPKNFYELTNKKLTSEKPVCSLDFSNSGIFQFNNSTMNNFNNFYEDLNNINADHAKYHLQLFFSKIFLIRKINLTINEIFTISISNSNVVDVEPDWIEYKNFKINLKLSSVSMDISDWYSMLNVENIKNIEIANSDALMLDKKNFPNSIELDTKSTIEEVFINNSNLQRIDRNFFLLNFFRNSGIIYLKHCSIKTIEENLFNRNGKTYEKLDVFSLQNNFITKIRRYTFDGLVNLRKLYLDNNQIENIDENAFTSLKQLSLLSLRNNNLMKSGFGWLKNSLIHNAFLTDILINSKNNRVITTDISENFCLLIDISTWLNEYPLAHKKRFSLFDRNDFQVDFRNVTANQLCLIGQFCSIFANITRKKISKESLEVCKNVNSDYKSNATNCTCENSEKYLLEPIIFTTNQPKNLTQDLPVDELISRRNVVTTTPSSLFMFHQTDNGLYLKYPYLIVITMFVISVFIFTILIIITERKRKRRRSVKITRSKSKSRKKRSKRISIDSDDPSAFLNNFLITRV